MKRILLSLLLLFQLLIHGNAKAISIPPKSLAHFPRGGSQTTTTPSKHSSALAEGLKNTLASGLAAACSKTILAPFDTIKTVQQDVMGGRSLTLVEAIRKICGRDGGFANLYVRSLLILVHGADICS